jgi:CheY-like chemotaxis protein
MSELAGKSVLLLEDEFLIAMDAEEILKQLGVVSIEVVGTIADARKAAEAGQFDVALLDVNINGEMSFPVAERLKQRGIPFVFASGYEMRDRAPPEADAALCLAKPYTTDALKDALCAALSAAR